MARTNCSRILKREILNFVGTELDKLRVCQTHTITYLRGDLAPSSHHSILIEISLVGKANWEKDLSIALMHLTKLQCDLFGD